MKKIIFLLIILFLISCGEENNKNLCDGVSCGDHGVCIINSDTESIACLCDDGYSADGLNCVEDIVEDKCEGVTCSNHGTCVVENDQAVCNCDDGYSADGLNCVEDIVEDKCEGITCSNHGTCVVENDQAVCNCDEGYSADGLNCVEDIIEDQCEGVTCSNHGTCVVENDQAICNCDEGYSANGLNCVEDIVDVCENINCPTNSHCEPDENSEAACYCDEGYVVNENGDACVPEDVCENVNCPTNSHCEPDENSEAACYCDEGYVVNDNGDACVPENISEDSPFANFNIWRSTDGSQLWGRWVNDFTFNLQEITVEYPDGGSVRTTLSLEFLGGYDDYWLLSDNGGFTEGTYTITLRYSTSNGSVAEKVIERVVENEIYRGEEPKFSSTTGRIDTYDGLTLTLTPNFSGNIHRIMVYTLDGNHLYTTSYYTKPSLSSGISTIVEVGGYFDSQTLLIVVEGVDNSTSYTYYTSFEVEISE